MDKNIIVAFLTSLITMWRVAPDLHIYNVNAYRTEPFVMKYNFLDILDDDNLEPTDVLKRLKQRIEMVWNDWFDRTLFLITFKKWLRWMNNDWEIIKKIVYIYDDDRFKKMDENWKNEELVMEVWEAINKSLDNLKDTSWRIYPISFKEIEDYVNEWEIWKFFEALKKD